MPVSAEEARSAESALSSFDLVREEPSDGPHTARSSLNRMPEIASPSSLNSSAGDSKSTSICPSASQGGSQASTYEAVADGRSASREPSGRSIERPTLGDMEAAEEESSHTTSRSPTMMASGKSGPSMDARSQCTTITCWHPAICQRSYAKEKRFLRPPPMVCFDGDLHRESSGQLEISILAPTCSASEELENLAAENVRVTSCDTTFFFKNLHVRGAKSKTFRLCITFRGPHPSSLFPGSPRNTHPRSQEQDTQSAKYELPASVRAVSGSLSILSKPAKAESKTRAPLFPLRAGTTVSLFQRLNSQNTRTRYLYVNPSTKAFEASASIWTPLVIEEGSSTPDSGESSSSHLEIPSFSHGLGAFAADLAPLSQLPNVTPHKTVLNIFPKGIITLYDPVTGVRSPHLLLHKIENGRVISVDNPNRGALSQLQKVAFTKAGLEQEVQEQGYMYFGCSAVSTAVDFICPRQDSGASPSLRRKSGSKDGQIDSEALDDVVCWSIVAVGKFTFTVSPGAVS